MYYIRYNCTSSRGWEIPGNDVGDALTATVHKFFRDLWAYSKAVDLIQTILEEVLYKYSQFVKFKKDVVRDGVVK